MAALRELVEQQEALAKEGKSVAHLDIEFHLTLAKAGGDVALESSRNTLKLLPSFLERLLPIDSGR